MSKLRVGLFLGLVGLAAALGTVRHRLRHQEGRATAATAPEAQQHAEPTLPATAGHAAESALALEYAVDFASTMRADSGEQLYALTGQLKLVLFQREDAHGLSAFDGEAQEISVVIDSEDEAASEMQKGMVSDLSRGFALYVSPDGRIAQFGVSKTLAPNTESLLRSIASALQYVPNKTAATTWEASEADHLGAFQAKYRKLGAENVEKTKVYSKLALPEEFSGFAGKALGATGHTALTLGPGGPFPARAQAEEQLNLGSMRLDQRITMTLAGARRIPRAPLDATNKKLSALNVAVSGHADHANQRTTNEHLVAGASYRDLTAALDHTDTSDEKVTERHNLTDRLRALFELDPQAVAAGTRSLRDGSAGKQAAPILGALAHADSDDARRALIGLASDHELPTNLRSNVLTNMAVQGKPSSETIRALGALQKDTDDSVRGSATLALGSSLHAAADNPALNDDAGRASHDLAQTYQTTQDPAERALLLKALGNAGTPDTLTVAKAAASDPNPLIRRNAIRALRLVPGAEADQLIAQAWLNDPEAEVRSAAVFAASSRPASELLAKAALASIAADSNGGVRLATLKFMVDEVSVGGPAFIDAIRKAAQQDPDEQLRAIATQFLERAGA